MYHKIIILGNLGRDPEMRYTQQGTPVAVFTVAANRRYKNQEDQLIEETIWFRVSAWGRLAEMAHQYLRKGMRVYIEGRLVPDPQTGQPRLFTRSDGTVGTSYEVRANLIRILTPRGEELPAETAGPADIAAAPPSTPSTGPVDDLPGEEEEIPF